MLYAAGIRLGPLCEGAVERQRDWGREFGIIVLSLRHGLRRATSLTEGGNKIVTDNAL